MTVYPADKIPIIQGGRNKVLTFKDFISKLTINDSEGFYNVSYNPCHIYLTLSKAVSLVPVNKRALGLVITFHNEKNTWVVYQFRGSSLNQWDTESCWKNLLEGTDDSYIAYPDEEDITAVDIDGKMVFKLKDKPYEPAKFSGKGLITLRKNIVGSNSLSLDPDDQTKNVLKQFAINSSDTIYIIKYNFDLDGNTINIPADSVLWFQGGSLNNGTIYLNNTAVWGVTTSKDIGTAKILGNYVKGQQMVTLNEKGSPVLNISNGVTLNALPSNSDLTYFTNSITWINTQLSQIGAELDEHKESIDKTTERANSNWDILGLHDDRIDDLETWKPKAEKDISGLVTEFADLDSGLDDIKDRMETLESSNIILKFDAIIEDTEVAVGSEGTIAFSKREGYFFTPVKNRWTPAPGYNQYKDGYYIVRDDVFYKFNNHLYEGGFKDGKGVLLPYVTEDKLDKLSERVTDLGWKVADKDIYVFNGVFESTSTSGIYSEGDIYFSKTERKFFIRKSDSWREYDTYNQSTIGKLFLKESINNPELYMCAVRSVGAGMTGNIGLTLIKFTTESI